MKVIHVLNSREYTGAEKVVCQIIHDFENDPGMEMLYCSPYSDNIRDMVEGQGIRYLSLPKLTPGALKAVLDKEKPDFIHAHDMRASFVSALCCGKIPVISHIHNNAYDARGLSPKSVAYILAGLRARRILWVSRSSYEGYLFHKLFAKKSSVLYNIIDAEAISKMLAADENQYDYDLIFVGRLTYQKDPQRLLRLCARLKERKPDLKAAVVGAGELEEECRALSAQLGLEENVSFLGFQANPIKMIHDSRCLVLTSRWEGTPMCALEAMCLGTPVVSTPSDGMRDILENGVEGFLEETDEGLENAVLAIVNDENLRERMGRAAVEKFSAINDAPAYKRAIRECYR